MSDPSTKASTRVVSIPELLERILLNLPLGDLLFSRQAHPIFAACINKSPTLQHQFFRQFSPSQSDRITTAHPDEYHPDSLHDAGLHRGLQINILRDSFGEIGDIYRVTDDRKDYKAPHIDLKFFSTARISPPADLSLHAMSSYIGIYLQQHSVPTRVTVCNNVDIIRPGLDASWHSATVMVKSATLRQLLGLAGGLKEAARTLQGNKAYENDWCYNEQGMVAYEMPLPVDDCEWRDYSSKEQLESMFDEVKIDIPGCCDYPYDPVEV